jgi:hypothetical protein
MNDYNRLSILKDSIQSIFDWTVIGIDYSFPSKSSTTMEEITTPMCDELGSFVTELMCSYCPTCINYITMLEAQNNPRSFSGETTPKKASGGSKRGSGDGSKKGSGISKGKKK